MNTLRRSCEVRHFGFEAPGEAAREANAELACSSSDEGKWGVGSGGGHSDDLFVAGQSRL